MGAAGGSNADLVLEGGGVKGIGLVDAYLTLVEHGYQIRRGPGRRPVASWALIAADMAPDLMVKTMREVDYGAFQDKGLLDYLGRLGKGASILFEKGIYEGEYLRTWLDDLLTDLGKATFGDLKIDDPSGSRRPDEDSYRLVVLTSDVSRGRLVRLPWDYHLWALSKPPGRPQAVRRPDHGRQCRGQLRVGVPARTRSPRRRTANAISRLPAGGPGNRSLRLRVDLSLRIR